MSLLGSGARYVVRQLRCLGILQTCEVLKVGMPTRVTYTELKEVLGESAPEAEKLFHGEPETALIAAILWAFEVTKKNMSYCSYRCMWEVRRPGILTSWEGMRVVLPVSTNIKPVVET